MEHFLSAEMQSGIKGGAYEFAEMTDIFPGIVQLYGADLDNFKGEGGIFILFARGTLVPFQVQ